MYNIKTYDLMDWLIDSIDIDGVTHGLFPLVNLELYRYSLIGKQLTLKTKQEIINLFQARMQYLADHIAEYPFNDVILYSGNGYKAEDYEQYVRIPIFKVDNLYEIVQAALQEEKIDE